MSASPATEEILNILGGQRYINNLMAPKMLIGSELGLGIRLSSASKNKINHIEITKDENGFQVDFWAFPKDILKHRKVASYSNIAANEVKSAIEAQTNFVFQNGDAEKNAVIAAEIINQLGGASRLNMMLGLKQSVPVENGVLVSFKVEAANGINGFEIVLDPSDTYTVKFLKITASKRTEISSSSMIYNDMLIESIQNELQCSLVPPRFL